MTSRGRTSHAVLDGRVVELSRVCAQLDGSAVVVLAEAKSKGEPASPQKVNTRNLAGLQQFYAVILERTTHPAPRRCRPRTAAPCSPCTLPVRAGTLSPCCRCARCHTQHTCSTARSSVSKTGQSQAALCAVSPEVHVWREALVKQRRCRVRQEACTVWAQRFAIKLYLHLGVKARAYYPTARNSMAEQAARQSTFATARSAAQAPSASRSNVAVVI